jgi:hippurate hydrolase
MKPLEAILEDRRAIGALRRDIHAHPEIAFEEQRTSDLLAKVLTERDIPIHRGLGKTGVVGIVKSGSSSRAVGLRADIDALPMTKAAIF